MAGPFIFRWVNEGALPFDALVHANVNDENVFSIEITHSEGDFPTLELTIINPRVGLLGPDRMLWGWLSYDIAWREDELHTPDIRPLFYGRLIGIPEDLQAEQVVLSFLARPLDYAEQKSALAYTMRDAPFWDPVWFSPDNRDDPDNVLESRTELWHIDRLTHEVTSSDLLVGEDGTEVIGEGEEFYDSLRIGFGSAPLRKVQVTASVSWGQSAKSEVLGSIDLQTVIGNSILSYTGASLIENWPKTGESLGGGGWAVADGHAERIDSVFIPTWMYEGIFPEPELDNTSVEPPPVLPQGRPSLPENSFSVTVPYWSTAGSFSIVGGGSGATYSWPRRVLVMPLVRVHPTLKIGYDVTRSRSETLTFVLEANVQPILTEPGDEEVLSLTFNSSEIMSAIDPSGSDSIGALMPIRDLRNPSYFATDRGQESLEYLLTLARARLLARARAVEIEFEIPFNLAVDLELSCRKSLHLSDYRIPGGQCAGKIMEYTLSVDGENGRLMCGIRIGCSVGEGGTVEAVEGEPTYVELGYVDSPYQHMLGAYNMPIAGEIAYGSINGLTPNDDGLNLFGMTAADVVLGYSVAGTQEEQEAAMGLAAREVNEVFARLDTVSTTITLTLRPLTGGPFNTDYAVPTSLLSVPKTIDLSADTLS